MGIRTDIDITRMACLTIVLDDVQTGDLSLEGTGDIQVRTVCNLLTVKVFYRADELRLLQGTVTDDNRLLEGLGIILEVEVDLRTLTDGDFLRLVPEELAHDHITFGGSERIGSVCIRRGSSCRILHHKGGSDDRLIVRRIQYNTGNSHILRKSTYRHKKRQQCYNAMQHF